MFILLFIYFTFAKLTPENVPLTNVYQKDITNMVLSNNGRYVCVTTLGGDAKLLLTNGTVIYEFKRYAFLGEYMITCTFSPQTKWLVINSALEINQFCRKSYIRLYRINRDYMPPMIQTQTITRQNCEFPWPNTYTFSNDDSLFAFVNFTSNLIRVYDFENFDEFDIEANTRGITTMIFSNDKQFMIWKDYDRGNVTMYNIVTKNIYKQFATKERTPDVFFYDNPSMIINDDGTYLVDCSSNMASITVINIIDNTLKTFNVPWMGGQFIFYKDSVLYVSIIDHVLLHYNLTNKTSEKLIPSTSNNFGLWNDNIVSLNNNVLMYCSLNNINKCVKGVWNNTLSQIEFNSNNNVLYTIDSLYNLVKWSI